MITTHNSSRTQADATEFLAGAARAHARQQADRGIIRVCCGEQADTVGNSPWDVLDDARDVGVTNFWHGVKRFKSYAAMREYLKDETQCWLNEAAEVEFDLDPEQQAKLCERWGVSVIR